MSIESDQEALGRIHHAVNIDKYPKKEFRKKLVEHLPPRLRQRYYESCGISDPNNSDNIRKALEFEWGDNQATRNFISHFSYPEYLMPVSRVGHDEEPFKMLMDYQHGIVFETLRRIAQPGARVLIQMPTGTGKTRVAMDIVCRLFNEYEGIQIIWFANREELLEQAAETFSHVWKHVGKFSDIETVRIWGADQITTIPEKNCMIFAGFQKFMRQSDIGVKPDYIFVDEAHQILAPKYESVIRNCSSFAKQTKIVGLTATPGRGINERQNNLLVEKFHTNMLPITLCNDELEEQYEGNIVEYLEDEDVLARATLEPLDTGIDFELTDEEWKQLKNLAESDYGNYPEFSESTLRKLASDNGRNILIINRIRQYAKQKKKILYFGTSKRQSMLTSIILQKLGVKAVHVDADTDKSFRKQIIAKFKDTEEINTICNYDIFSTGFDVPNLDVVFIGRPVNSPVLFNQIVGRGTRGLKMGGKSTFTLAQVIDRVKSPRFVGFDPYEQYKLWDPYWNKG